MASKVAIFFTLFLIKFISAQEETNLTPETCNYIGGTFTNESFGYICSHSDQRDTSGYTGQYSTSTETFWFIEVSPGNRILIEFEGRYGFESCCDYVQVFNYHENSGNYSDSEAIKFGKSTMPETYITDGNKIKLRFWSDSSETSYGFRLKWSEVETLKCLNGGIQTGDSGVIESPKNLSLSEGVSNFLSCSWSIQVDWPATIVAYVDKKFALRAHTVK